jgi:Base plate wedge protein 53.
MPQFEFDNYLIEKYETYENLNSIHHYETVELKNDNDVIIVQKGLKVPSDYSITYFESSDIEIGMVTKNPVVAVTNYEYEEKLNENKRNIYLLKKRYLNLIIDDLENIMRYRKGSSQYKTETLKTADNIRLF